MKTIMKMMLTFFSAMMIMSLSNAQEEYKPEREGKKDIRKFTVTLPGKSRAQQITAEVVDNLVIYQGDIILGPLEEFQSVSIQAVVIDGNSFRWPNSTIPFVISDGHPSAAAINSAIAMVNANTNLNVVPQTTQSAFIRFVDATGCASFIGKIGNGGQDISIGNCPVGSIAHEILHAAGLFHEQSREDRDNFITVNFANIEEDKEVNFEKEVSGVSDIGTYDYGSIMHYNKTAFSKNGLNTIDIDIPPGTSTTIIGQRTALSPEDITAINTLYAPAPCKSSLTTTMSSQCLGAPITVNFSMPNDCPVTPVSCRVNNTALTISNLTTTPGTGTTPTRGSFTITLPPQTSLINGSTNALVVKVGGNTGSQRFASFAPNPTVLTSRVTTCETKITLGISKQHAGCANGIRVIIESKLVIGTTVTFNKVRECTNVTLSASGAVITATIPNSPITFPTGSRGFRVKVITDTGTGVREFDPALVMRSCQ